ncbi:HNH endonuclease signature motif containing protein [Pelomonas sp. APW6]|uniref:HNH endonuclease signature motif containing protein n=1 Tax=Roseateles subflavus TaxID=3053353 RepID=A0ABT7LN41_9BURK|nr:HNH endonuclease signature motif containing protein [Pelomonas sp. APW6]MDL5034296.1 HNH endonuclease signature motif containing protein [Pelomonas sp. APW6]
MLKLLLSVKRRVFRQNDAEATLHDQAFKAKRANALQRHRFTCSGCGYSSKNTSHLDVHHLDDNHRNQADENLVAACHICHNYQHIGEADFRYSKGPTQPRRTMIATIPEISPADLNLLQRAIGVALLDAQEADLARRLADRLAARGEVTEMLFGSKSPSSWAGAMASMSAGQFAARADVIVDERLLLHPEELKELGREMLADNPTLPLSKWANVARSTMSSAAAAPSSPSAGLLVEEAA